MPAIDPRIERKLGRRVLRLVAEMQAIPAGDMKRFVIVRDKLDRATKDYMTRTGRDALDGTVNYGYSVS